MTGIRAVISAHPAPAPDTAHRKDRALTLIPRPETPGPYADSRSALADVARVIAVRQELVDASARAFHFDAMRQPNAAALFARLDDLAVLRYLGRSGYRRATGVLMAVQGAGRDLELLEVPPRPGS